MPEKTYDKPEEKLQSRARADWYSIRLQPYLHQCKSKYYERLQLHKNKTPYAGLKFSDSKESDNTRIWASSEADERRTLLNWRRTSRNKTLKISLELFDRTRQNRLRRWSLPQHTFLFNTYFRAVKTQTSPSFANFLFFNAKSIYIYIYI